MPTFLTPKNCAQIVASVSSIKLRGATYLSESSLPYSGAGKARRSILPLGVKGNNSSITKALGIMYFGN